MGTYKDLLLYKKTFSLSMQIFNITKLFPKEETYSLTEPDPPIITINKYLHYRSLW
ncbi:four helix bundle protein [Mucilaginibacter sp. UR6-1]|uniref:four helix bundle protein n=1 Tax=Mucilaginibacter sp. UR6-1 TaxID=1435643 RepID=UPI00351D4CFA